MKSKIFISLAIGGFFSALAMYFAFRNVPMTDLVRYLVTINYWWLVPTAAIIVITFVLRVIRWQIILKNAQMVPFWPAFHPLMIGFMMNCVLPGRIGEIARPVLLKKDRKIPIATGLATVAAERLFDIVMLIILFGAVFSSITEKPDLQVSFGSQVLNSQTLQSIAWGLIRLSLVLLTVMVLCALPKGRQIIARLAQAFTRLPLFADTRIQPLLEKIIGLGIHMMDNFAKGLSLVAQPMRMAGCSLLTLLIWGLTLFSYYLMSLGCPGLELSLRDWATVMVIVCFFIALPSVPGFWGLWEAGGVFALSLFGVNSQEAAGFTLVNHAVNLFPVILIGLLSAMITSVNIFNVRLDENRA